MGFCKTVISLITAPFFYLSSWYFFQNNIIGNGNIITTEQTVAPLRKIAVAGDAQIVIHKDNCFCKPTLSITSDENIINAMVIESKKETLSIEPEKNSRLIPTKTTKIVIKTPTLKSISSAGNNHIVTEGYPHFDQLTIKAAGNQKQNINGTFHELTVKAAGNNNITLSGQTDQLTIHSAGNSKINAQQLVISDTAKISAAGNTTVYIRQAPKTEYSMVGGSKIITE